MPTIMEAHENLLGALKELENNEIEYEKGKGTRETDILSCRVSASKNAVIKYTKEFVHYLKQAGIEF